MSIQPSAAPVQGPPGPTVQFSIITPPHDTNIQTLNVAGVSPEGYDDNTRLLKEFEQWDDDWYHKILPYREHEEP